MRWASGVAACAFLAAVNAYSWGHDGSTIAAFACGWCASAAFALVVVAVVTS